MDTIRKIQEFNDLNGEITAMFHQAAVDAGISDSAQSILYTLLTLGHACTQSDISRQTGLSRQTINSAIRCLERQGVLYLHGQGKSKHVLLTESGRDYARQKAGQIIAAEATTFESWPQEDVEALLTLTRRYIRGIRNNYQRNK